MFAEPMATEHTTEFATPKPEGELLVHGGFHDYEEGLEEQELAQGETVEEFEEEEHEGAPPSFLHHDAPVDEPTAIHEDGHGEEAHAVPAHEEDHPVVENDDSGLEHEADAMGEKELSASHNVDPLPPSAFRFSDLFGGRKKSDEPEPVAPAPADEDGIFGVCVCAGRGAG